MLDPDELALDDTSATDIFLLTRAMRLPVRCSWGAIFPTAPYSCRVLLREMRGNGKDVSRNNSNDDAIIHSTMTDDSDTELSI